MELSRYTDYSLRVLLYVAARKAEKVTLAELAQIYQISPHHLVKIVHQLGKMGYLENRRGRNGGIRLGLDASSIGIGHVIRQTETHLDLVECFKDSTNTCRLSSQCRLKGVLWEAKQAFLDVLDHYTLEDVLLNGNSILQLMKIQNKVSILKPVKVLENRTYIPALAG